MANACCVNRDASCNARFAPLWIEHRAPWTHGGLDYEIAEVLFTFFWKMNAVLWCQRVEERLTLEAARDREGNDVRDHQRQHDLVVLRHLEDHEDREWE